MHWNARKTHEQTQRTHPLLVDLPRTLSQTSALDQAPKSFLKKGFRLAL